MQCEVTTLSPVFREVRVSVPWERVEGDMDTRLKRVVKTAKIRGFRPGKAPRNVVQRVYGSELRRQVMAALLEEGLTQAVSEHDLKPVAEPSFDFPEFEQGKALQFCAKLEVQPDLGVVKLEPLEIESAAVEVSDAEIDSEIEKLREKHVQLQVPDPVRASKEGDEVQFSFEIAIDGEVNASLSQQEQRGVIGGGRLLPELDEGLKGVKAGDKTTLTVQFPNDHMNETLRGKEATFNVSVEEVRERLLPEVDDEFAKDCGDFETLLELRLDIRKKLEAQAESEQASKLRELLFDAVLKLNEVVAPPSLIEREYAYAAYEHAWWMAMSGGSAETLPESVKDDLRKRAERRVQVAFLLRAVAKQAGLEVNAEDVDAHLSQVAEERNEPLAKVRGSFGPEEKERLQSQLLEQKVVDFLKNRATIKAESAKQSESSK